MDHIILTPDILKSLDLDTFVAIDTETTGFDRLQDDIIEFGAVKYIDGEQVDILELLIKPKKDIPVEITRLTGISNDMVKDAPAYVDVHDEIKDFLGAHPLVAHRVVFDSEMLSAHYQRHSDDELENPLNDSLILARTFTYWLVDHKLNTVAKAFDVQRESAHRAYDDAAMAGDIFLSLVQMMLCTPIDTLRQCSTILSDVSLHTKPLFINVLNYLMSQNADDGLGEPLIKPPLRFNVYGEGGMSYEGAGEPLQSLDTFELTRHFTKDGNLGKALKQFEVRDAQAAMAESVAESLNAGHFLVAEAGTGVGKSLAYALPAILWALENNDSGERVVISSNTKNLQEQLFFKDIPFIHDELGYEFKAVLLKGRGNYLCKTKWTEFLRNIKNFSNSDRVAALPLVVWASRTNTGDISDNNGFHERRNTGLWKRLSSEGGYCTTKRCQAFKGCFLGPLKKEAARAHLVLVNHSLLLADAAGGHMAIPEYHHLVVDEAHNLEKSAYRYFASEFDFWTVKNMTGQLYTKSRIEYGTLVTLKTALAHLKNEQQTKNAKQLIQDTIDYISNLEKSTENFLTMFQAESGKKQTQFRYTEKVRYTRENSPFVKLKPQIIEVNNHLRDLIKSLQELHRDLKNYTDTDIPDVDMIRQELGFSIEELTALLGTFRAIIKSEDPEQIYWYELPVSDKRLPKLVTTPIHIGYSLQEKIYDNLRTAVFTSATIKVADEFTYFLKRNGLDDLEHRTVITEDFGSPYYLSEQLIGCVTTYLDTPGSKSHSKQVSEIIRKISEKYKRGALILTTSYRTMDDIFNGMESYYKEMEVGLYRQTRQISRTDLVEQFKEDFSSVLIGTESFWEGVDVPGQALEVLIIGKLPFSVPTDPIVEANTKAVEDAGGNGFIDYTLPEAIIQFRQGFGRLIRSSSDAGVVIIADPRVATKFYGRYIAESLPIELQPCQSEEELFGVLDNWFRRN